MTLAVYLLGGRDRAVDTEDVAMKCHEIWPGRFSWRKYQDQINLELVRVHLSDAKSADAGTLLSGSGTKGWTLTARGLEWASGVAGEEIGELGSVERRKRGGSIDAQRADRERARIEATAAWKKWPHAADQISALEAQEVFRLDSYATEELRNTKVDRLRKIFLADIAVLEFIAHLDRLLSNPGTATDG